MNANPEPFVIVGAGLAGAKAAETLREEGFGGRLALIEDEPELLVPEPADDELALGAWASEGGSC
jgi:NADPH-dependent 2,4-dienoyl-CoA reductase/sulfur reductase-like enzyme